MRSARSASPAWRWTRLTACRSGGTTSGPTTCGWPTCASGWGRRRRSRSPRPRPAASARTSSRRCGCATRSCRAPGFDRPNLAFAVVPVAGDHAKPAMLLRLLQAPGALPGGRLLRSQAHVRGGRRGAGGGRDPRGRLPRRPGREPPHRDAGRVPGRRPRRRRGDDRLRHGHRQGGRALGGALGAARLAGGVLPAGGPRRPRRRARPLHAALQPARQGPDRLLHQPRQARRRPPSRPSIAAWPTVADAGGVFRAAERALPCEEPRAAVAALERAGALELFPAPMGTFSGPARRLAPSAPPPRRGDGGQQAGRAPALGPAEGDRRLRDHDRLPPGGAARVLRRPALRPAPRSLLRSLWVDARALRRGRGSRAGPAGRAPAPRPTSRRPCCRPSTIPPGRSAGRASRRSCAGRRGGRCAPPDTTRFRPTAPWPG